MELQHDLPPDYASHEPADLRLPAVPQHDFVTPQTHADITLPDLKAVLSQEYHHASPPTQHTLASLSSPASARGLARTEQVHAHSNGMRRSADGSAWSPSETGSVKSAEGRGPRSLSVVSMDDPDVRIAAEALSGLGNPDFVRSPNAASYPPSYATGSVTSHTPALQMEPEPLLQLLTQAHPWVGGTINTSLSAYSTTKHYSPRLVQAGANLVERNITTPVVSTVSSVGRMTGVESVARWYLASRQPNEHDQWEEKSSPSKRRRVVSEDEMDIESGLISPRDAMRHGSLDSRSDFPPAYRASKPPSYREEHSPTDAERSRQIDRPSHNRTWSSQIFVMTSGLGVALSETSRESLRFCLTFLGRATEHIATVMDALKLVLEQYDQARDHWHQHHDSSMEKGERPQTPDHDQAARRLAEIIKKHSDDIWQTLKGVVSSVSNSAGGALPENARHFVRTQLMSLPQRWRVVSDGQTGDSETSRGAHRMIAFATEGLDMMSQVSQVCKATLDSADIWIQRVGRRRATEQPGSKGHSDGDHDLVDAPDAFQPPHVEKK